MHQAINELLGVGNRLIMDPVHGGISLYRHEVLVIDHPLFQRLRNICQNDILSLVFPGATHSRFLHSIGTLHVGHRIYRGLIENCLRRSGKNSEAATQVDFRITAKQLEAINYFNKLVRLACLLHDCGHSSFSHQFAKVPTIADLLATPGMFRALWRDSPHDSLYHHEPICLEHEHYSVRCASTILDWNICQLGGIQAQDVMALMETTTGLVSTRFKLHVQALWPLLTDTEKAPENAHEHVKNLLKLIISGEIDADRADYMLRDGFHSSVTIGGFNLDHLLKNLHVGWDSEANWMGLAITHKALGALEDFVYSRHQMYRKVYGHKTSIGFDWLLRKAIEEVLQQPSVHSYLESSLTNIEEFQYLTDNYFWEQFRIIARQYPNTYSAMMVHRKRLRHLHSVENIKEENLLEKRLKVAQFNAIEQEQIVTCELKAKFSKIGNNFNAIKVLNRQPITAGEKPYYSLIADESRFFDKFVDGNIVHFYEKPKIQNFPSTAKRTSG